ncbi:MAG UNVERIFIED_CONTAM: hypothetical protein LVR18_13920 [Planctomycetaceae bacterium]|jgi:hypothetical protein
MSLIAHCTPRPSVFAADRRATVLNLDAFLKGQVHGSEFFEENYFTNGNCHLSNASLPARIDSRFNPGAPRCQRFECETMTDTHPRAPNSHLYLVQAFSRFPREAAGW